jgi:hypothetical protein
MGTPDPARSSALLSFRRVTAAVLKNNKSDVGALLDKQAAYLLHRPVRKRFLRNPCTLTIEMDVWKCDLLDILSLAQIHSHSHRGFLKISPLCPRKCREWPFRPLGASVHISPRRRLALSRMCTCK